MGRKVLDSLDLMLRQQDAAKPGQVKPLIGGAFDATEVEVERVNVHVGSHWHVLKKQEPPPKERLRALLVEQSGVMMATFLPVAWVVVKLSFIVRILLSTGRAIRLRIRCGKVADNCEFMPFPVSHSRRNRSRHRPLVVIEASPPALAAPENYSSRLSRGNPARA